MYWTSAPTISVVFLPSGVGGRIVMQYKITGDHGIEGELF